MDELELLKKDWQSPKNDYTTFSEKELYPMIHKKSSSIVKTLFYISIAELVFWLFANLGPYFLSKDYKEKLNEIYGHTTLYTTLTIISLVVIVFFIYLLFGAQKSISVTDNARLLMAKILKTRKIIKWYVIFNLVMISSSTLMSIYFMIERNPEFQERLSTATTIETFQIGFKISLLILFCAGILWLFYRLIYGILLGRLNKNYKELKRLEV